MQDDKQKKDEKIIIELLKKLNKNQKKIAIDYLHNIIYIE